MATKPKPVPWEDVVDACGDLFEWLVANGHARKGEFVLSAALRVLAESGPDRVLAFSVARALMRLELYRNADRSNDARALFAGSRMAQEIKELIFDYSIEQKGERDIRALSPRLAEIRRLIGKIEDRKIRRQALSPGAPLSDADRQYQQSTLKRVLASLNAAGQAMEDLLQSYRQFSPAMTDYPLTFAGWKKFETAVRAELTKLGFVWPE